MTGQNFTEAKCVVCGGSMRELFSAPSQLALLSSANVVPGKTIVDSCPRCGHLQTRPIVDVAEYYKTDYQFQIMSHDDDDVYDRQNGRNIYRSEYQAELTREKLTLDGMLRVLDYGCGKARTLSFLVKAVPNLSPYVFEVSDNYISFWNQFIPKDHQACFRFPDSWSGTIDVVVSFFALEHTTDPHAFMQDVRRMLKVGGKFFFAVPNVISNVSDMAVADHFNHFSAASLRYLLLANGFDCIEIDKDSFRGAFCVTASKNSSSALNADGVIDQGNSDDADRVARFWKNAFERVREIESKHESAKWVIYGSGIFGLFIAGSLRNKKRVLCFLDENPFRRERAPMGIPVIPPDEIPQHVDVLYVGLNPSISKKVITESRVLSNLTCQTFYI